ncbi:adaptor protein MecA [Lactococcus garvieae]
MQYEEINEKTIKISLTFQDLVDHDVKLSDFLLTSRWLKIFL